jgi:hypothetical protein
MERRGHEIVWPDGATGLIDRRDLLSSDVVLVFRSHDAVSRKLLREAREHGVGIVWDVDDDMRNSPFSPFGKHGASTAESRSTTTPLTPPGSPTW